MPSLHRPVDTGWVLPVTISLDANCVKIMVSIYYDPATVTVTGIVTDPPLSFPTIVNDVDRV